MAYAYIIRPGTSYREEMLIWRRAFAFCCCGYADVRNLISPHASAATLNMLALISVRGHTSCVKRDEALNDDIFRAPPAIGYSCLALLAAAGL